MTTIFLSHSSSDHAQASEIVSLLQGHGLEIWYSDYDIKATADWEQSIRTALDRCEWFIVLLSRESVKSEWVRAEVHWAIENRPNKIVPVLVEDCDTAKLHLRLATIQFIDLVRDRVGGLDELLEIWKVATDSAEGRFSPIESLGKGGMGEVTLAYDERLQRQVAIKRMLPDLATSDSFRRRFLQEARDSAALNHPNIVPILTIGDDANGPFLVLEYLDGGTLEDRLRDGRMSLNESLAFLRQLLDALRHAHEKGVIHRDIKPQNVLLTKGGVPKLSDFGLAWVVGQDDRFESDRREGTTRYLAPELRNREEPPNPRTDIYALGLTFYQMLTGERGSSIRETEVPSTVLPFLTKLVDENPNLRYASAIEALDECVEIERSLALAEKTETKTRKRLSETVDSAFEHCAAGRTIDAEAALERVVSEDPSHFGALTGQLLLNLVKGDMDRSADLYDALISLPGEDPTFDRLKQFIEALREPVRLTITPRAMPFSYTKLELSRSRFTKELVPFAKGTVNLGDVGELLMDLASSQHRTESIEFEATGIERHKVRFVLDGVDVLAEYENQLERRMLRQPELKGMQLGLTVTGEPFKVYRLVRYLLNNLAVRFKRPLSALVIQNDMSAEDAKRHVDAWTRFDLDFTEIARARVKIAGQGEQQ